ncbi:MAG: peptidoglycan-binding protein [Candidatus Nomurabacteria bacterium]|nr:peptidoglycan-binding protein [Candidatus Nomurabacteria bacterium]
MKQSQFSVLALAAIAIITGSIAIGVGAGSGGQAQIFSSFRSLFQADTAQIQPINTISTFDTFVGSDSTDPTDPGVEFGSAVVNDSRDISDDIIGLTTIESSGADNCVWLFSYCSENDGEFSPGPYDVTCSCGGLSGVVTKNDALAAGVDINISTDPIDSRIEFTSRAETQLFPNIQQTISNNEALYRGVRDIDAVKELQQELSDVGIYDGRINGLFGRLTRKAVEEFQSANGIVADGIAGSETLRRLGGQYGAPTLTSGVRSIASLQNETLYKFFYPANWRVVQMFYNSAAQGEQGNFGGLVGLRVEPVNAVNGNYITIGGEPQTSCAPYLGGNGFCLVGDLSQTYNLAQYNIGDTIPYEGMPFIFGPGMTPNTLSTGNQIYQSILQWN